MALDVYAGPLTRYFTAAWETPGQRAGRLGGFPVETLRPTGSVDPADADLAGVEQALAGWRAYLSEGLACPADWPESVDGAYATDRPTWQGFGALVLTAARIAQPDHPGDDEAALADYAASAQVADAQETVPRFRSLLSGAEWWLPLETNTSTFTAGLPNGGSGPMATVALLASDLDELLTVSGLLDGTTVEAARTAHPNRDDGVRIWARFGAAALLPLVRFATAEQLPVVLDY